ncbi:MAG TPA: AAA family ATPase [Candidatus Sulfotelmatobacter sp.]|nr:AAA family ATPase [Candidatus Sulfotelmatobacter sp.]
MKIGVVGKGGSGKTSIAGMLARHFAKAGWEVIAVDCDANPNLGISVGLGLEPTERLIAIREGLDEGTVEHAATAEQVLERFGTTGPDGVRLAVVTKIDAPQSGCT